MTFVHVANDNIHPQLAVLVRQTMPVIVKWPSGRSLSWQTQGTTVDASPDLYAL